MVAHEEQIERIDGRLRIVYPMDFRELMVTAQVQGRETLDFLQWYAQRGARP